MTKGRDILKILLDIFGQSERCLNLIFRLQSIFESCKMQIYLAFGKQISA
jgi:hypothetical protein